MIVHVLDPVTLVGGGHLGTTDLAEALILAPVLVAADGGAVAALDAGLLPVAVIGDMDSLPLAAQDRLSDRLHPITEQDTTDFDKALRGITAPLVIAVGFTGGRLDHALAALHTLVLRPDRPCIILGPESLTFLCPPSIHLALQPDTIVSLFPLADCRVASQGLRWPTDHLDFAPHRQIGTSNQSVGPVTLQGDRPAMLVILPRATLKLASRALIAAPGWP
jgi:thiamine pyrophosphokinase